MSLTTYPHLEQGGDAWLEARRGIITASVIGALITTKTLAVANNETSRGTIAKIVAERITGEVEQSYINDDMARGNFVEPIARGWYATNHAPVTELGFMVREVDGCRVGFSPDGLVGDDGLIEIKAPRAKGHLLTHLSGEVPSHHLAQIQCGLLVSGRSWCDFISYHGGLPVFCKRVEADERWAEAIRRTVVEFEATASDMQATYTANTQGLPATEPLPDYSHVELKLA